MIFLTNTFLNQVNQKHKLILKIQTTKRKNLNFVGNSTNNESSTILQTLLTKHLRFSLMYLQAVKKQQAQTTNTLNIQLLKLSKTPTVAFLYIFLLWAVYYSSYRLFFHFKKTTTANTTTSLNFIARKQQKTPTITFKQNYKIWAKKSGFLSKPIMLKTNPKINLFEDPKHNNIVKSKHIFILTVYLLALQSKNIIKIKKKQTTRLETKAVFALYLYFKNLAFQF